MKGKKKGFTLIELLMVIIIVGILATMSVPLYLKTVESARADDAVAMGHMLATAYRMYLVDHPGPGLDGHMTNVCNEYSCDNAPDNACRLAACNYVSKQNWDDSAYTYSVSANPAGVIASVRRKSGEAPGTTVSPYNGWGYDFNNLGGCIETGGAPHCPSF